ncbi:MAG: hypothetical protein RBR24_03730 [Candidatus Carbobacillus sp.]|nr:hypothetical protein [Candidatus Carbobacillus sp.]
MVACVTDRGNLSEQAKKLLELIKIQPKPAEQLAQLLDVPLFKVRASLREMTDAGLVVDTVEGYTVTEKGHEALQRQDD